MPKIRNKETLAEHLCLTDVCAISKHQHQVLRQKMVAIDHEA